MEYQVIQYTYYGGAEVLSTFPSREQAENFLKELESQGICMYVSHEIEEVSSE